jgi:1-acyl-sn-glycerol-3-phosphate acyltransferase
MNRLRLYLRLTRLGCVLLLGVMLGGLVSMLELLSRSDLLAFRQRMSRWFMQRLSQALPLQIRVTGVAPEQPMLWVSNHVSWLDIPLLGMLAPLSFLSKAEVRDWPLLGWLANQAGTLFIHRGANQCAEVNQQLREHLQQDHPLVLFPEGSTSDGSSLRTFHPRLLASAIDSGVALQPVAIRYMRNGELCQLSPFIDDDELLSHLLRLLSSEVVTVEIHLLTPISSQSASRNQLARQAKEMIAQALYGPVSVGEPDPQPT